MNLKTQDERAWYNKAIELVRLCKTYGVDLMELRQLEIELYDGFIKQYRKYPTSELREYIVQAVLFSEQTRLKRIESRARITK